MAGTADRASPRAGVADVVVGWAVIRGTARPGLDGPATPREIPRRTDPTAIGSVWPGCSEVVLVVEPAQCDVAPYGWQVVRAQPVGERGRERDRLTDAEGD